MRKYLILLLLLLIAFSGCKSGKGNEKLTRLAEVNGEVLYLEEFRSTFTDEQWNNLSAEQKKQEIEDWINVTLLAMEADALKLDEEKAVKQRIDYATKKVKANALISKRLANISIGEEELFNYYRVHQSDFQSKLLEYDVQRILCRDASTADILLKRLQGGYDFYAAVSEFSQESLKDNQGRMGFVSASGADSLYWRGVRTLEPNKPGIAKIQDKVYILRHTAQREGDQDANFTEYRSEIRAILLREHQKQVYEELVRELRMGSEGIYNY